MERAASVYKPVASWDTVDVVAWIQGEPLAAEESARAVLPPCVRATEPRIEPLMAHTCARRTCWDETRLVDKARTRIYVHRYTLGRDACFTVSVWLRLCGLRLTITFSSWATGGGSTST